MNENMKYGLFFLGGLAWCNRRGGGEQGQA